MGCGRETLGFIGPQMCHAHGPSYAILPYPDNVCR
jgi:hypothetical protein